MVDRRARRALLFLLFGLLTAALATGCGRSASDQTAAEQEEIEETADQQAAAGAASEDGQVWHWDGDVRALRNPFKRPFWARGPVVSESPRPVGKKHRVKPAVLRLQGILYSEHASKALINGRWVRVGDEIDQHRVVRIDRNAVLLRRRNGSLVSLRLANGR